MAARNSTRIWLPVLNSPIAQRLGSSVLSRCAVSDAPVTNPGPAASLSEGHLSGVKSAAGDTGYITWPWVRGRGGRMCNSAYGAQRGNFRTHRGESALLSRLVTCPLSCLGSVTNVTSDEADVAPKGSQKLYAYLATSSQLSNSSAARFQCFESVRGI